MTGFDKVVEMTRKIGDCLPQFKNCEGLFKENKGVRDILSLFYRDILDSYAIMLKFSRLKVRSENTNSTNRTQPFTRLEACL